MGLSKANQTSFKKGQSPWNKDKKNPEMIGNTFGFKKGMTPWNKDKKGWVSDKQKKAISKSNKGRIPSNKGISKYPKQINCLYCGKLVDVPIKNAKNRKFCNHLCQSSFIRGEKHWNWQDDKMAEYPEKERIRKSFEYKLWRKSVFERDKFTCQKTGTKGGELVAHHINNFADFEELRLALDNGITLSKKVHDEFHKIYGKKNNTREQLIEFLKKSLPKL